MKYLILILFVLMLAGCSSYRDTVREIGSSLGCTQIRDIQEARAWEKAIPTILNINSSQVEAQPKPRYTILTISGVKGKEQQDVFKDKIEDFRGNSTIFEGKPIKPVEIIFKQ